ncbi:MAG: alpha-glucan family phosphorylase [Gemmatimonadales bacterium]|nr:alpha-glucan family phosphorylase [Gemmatimonadales bacterium]
MTAPRVAYFSMEVAFEGATPTYSGGLGVLAGDTLTSAADLGVPLIAVSLAHREGYFRQRLDRDGVQSEEDVSWDPSRNLERLEAEAVIHIEGRPVRVGAWRVLIQGATSTVPLLLLDTDRPGNADVDRRLTGRLYRGDDRYRLCQEVVLGMGGIALLAALGLDSIDTYHMNEGHSALLTVALLERNLGTEQLDSATDGDIEAIRERCVFTTHTPVPAGHDHFPRTLMEQVLGPARARVLHVTQCCPDGVLNLTFLALRFSRYINGVAMRHGEVSQGMFPRYPVRAITNGVNAARWVAPSFETMFDRHLPGWRRDNFCLRYAAGIELEEIAQAHRVAKETLLDAVRAATGQPLAADVLTLGFARRMTAYKRANLLFMDLDRLRRLAGPTGRLQVVFGGKAHPQDEDGKAAIRQVFEAARQLRGQVTVAFVEDYNIQWAQLLTSGVDVWLNTPRKPEEASGTSGMKAALNGVPSLSVLDGWWLEGCLEGITGWAIGADADSPSDAREDAESLYQKLEAVVLPTYYARPKEFVAVSRSAIALNGSFFTTQRMVAQYAIHAYGLAPLGDPAADRERDRTRGYRGLKEL